jgi:hypothetical protein
MKLAIQSGKPAVDSRSKASSSSMDSRGPSFMSASMCLSPKDTIEDPFGMSRFTGVLVSTSADKVMLLDVKSPNLMYWEISIRKVVVQSCMTELYLLRHAI